MTQQNQSAHWWILTRSIFLWGILGLFVSSVIAYVQPKRFASRVVLSARVEPDQSIKVAPVHVAQALRLAINPSDDWRPGADDISKVGAHSRIRSGKGTVEIEVIHTSKELARNIAMELAWLFRSMAEEESLSNASSEFPPISEEELELSRRRRELERVMRKEAFEKLGIWEFRGVPVLAKSDFEGAKELWDSEDFRRQWEFHQKLTGQLAGKPEPKGQVLEILEFPQIADHVSSPKVELYLSSGILLGLGLGAVRGARRVSKLDYSSGDSDQPVEAERLAFEDDPDGADLPLKQNPRPPTPEEKW